MADSNGGTEPLQGRNPTVFGAANVEPPCKNRNHPPMCSFLNKRQQNPKSQVKETRRRRRRRRREKKEKRAGKKIHTDTHTHTRAYKWERRNGGGRGKGKKETTDGEVLMKTCWLAALPSN